MRLLLRYCRLAVAENARQLGEPDRLSLIPGDEVDVGSMLSIMEIENEAVVTLADLIDMISFACYQILECA